MTTDKPGAVAMEAAVAVAKRYVEFAEAESETSLSLNDLAAIIRAAIDDATASLTADRDCYRANLSALETTAAKFQRERDEARAERDKWCLEADARTGTLTNVRRQCKEARTAARELNGELAEVEEYMESRADADYDGDGFVGNEEMRFLDRIRDVRAKHVALLAEPQS